MDSKDIRNKFNSDVQPLIDRLQALRDDDEREAAGKPRQHGDAKRAAEERHDLRRRLQFMDSAASQAMTAWFERSKKALAQARARSTTTDQERTADLIEADQLSRTTDASELLAQARQRLSIGDPRGADVRVRAAKLAAGTRPLRGIGQVAAEVEAALDEAVPHRQAAVDQHYADRLAFADAAIERIKVAQLAALLTGDRPAAARASASAKLRQYDLARAKGEVYEQSVELAPSGARD